MLQKKSQKKKGVNNMKVTLVSYTPNPEKLIASAAKMCYSPSNVQELMDNLTPEKVDKFVAMLQGLGHQSPFEHASFSFAIEGVSRSLLAQITRHRIASFSVKSQRYVREGSFEFVIPPEIEAIPDAKAIYLGIMAKEQKAYDDLTEILFNKHKASFLEEGNDDKAASSKAEKKAIEDARYVLPNACETKMMVTMNVRQLYHFFSLRGCNRAQWEIRHLAEEMFSLCYKVSPLLFEKAGPSCVYGTCKEGKMSCGQAKSVQEKYDSLKRK